MHGDGGDACLFGELRDARCVAAGEIPSGAHFSVTGTSTASTTRLQDLPDQGSSRISAEPAATLHTFLAGQPMLMSMICAPCATFTRAASAMRCGSVPTICTDTDPAAFVVESSHCLARAVQAGVRSHHLRTARPAPRRLHKRAERSVGDAGPWARRSDCYRADERRCALSGRPL